MTASFCYIHIPFCRQICSYCDFYRILHEPELERRYVDALITEIELRLSDSPGQPAELKTLYFGGGTPTVLAENSWSRLMTALKACFRITEFTEVTVEANPESATAEKLALLHSLGVNRLSLGAQTFDAVSLARLGRIHTATDVSVAVEAARSANFDDISLDMIYGLPDETEESFRRDLNRICDLEPQHISAYALLLEGDVPLQQQVERGELTLPTEDETAERYLRAVAHFASVGYEQYEISNFARPGRECRHNLAYWRGEDYIAVGPAAVGTLGGSRYRNDPDIRRYIENLSDGKLPPAEYEEITAGKRLIETIMLRLRLAEGLDLLHLQTECGYDLLKTRRKFIEALQEDGDINITNGILRLTPQGMFRSDLISALLLPDAV